MRILRAVKVDGGVVLAEQPGSSQSAAVVRVLDGTSLGRRIPMKKGVLYKLQGLSYAAETLDNVVVLEDGDDLLVFVGGDDFYRFENYAQACGNGACGVVLPSGIQAGAADSGAVLYRSGNASWVREGVLDGGAALLKMAAGSAAAPTSSAWGVMTVLGMAEVAASGLKKGCADLPPEIEVTVSGLVSAGPITRAAGLEVELFSGGGKSLGRVAVQEGGRFNLTVTARQGDVLIAKLIDNDSDPDFLDEASGAEIDMDAVMLVAFGVDSTGLSAAINPLTTVAARMAGITASASGVLTGGVTLAGVQAANIAVGRAAGADQSIAFIQAVPTITQGFNSADRIHSQGGLEAAEKVGVILAAISGMASQEGQQGAIDSLLNDTDLVRGGFSSASLRLLVIGALAASEKAFSARGPSFLDMLSLLRDRTLPEEAKTEISRIMADTATLTMMGENLAKLSPAAVAALPAVTVAALSAATLALLGNNLAALPSTTVAALQPEQITGLSGQTLAQLGGNLQNLSTATVGSINGTQLDSIANLSQLGSNLSALSSAAVASINSLQASTITRAQLTGFDAANMSATAITGLTAQAVASLTDGQLNALTSDQIAALQASGDLNLLTADQRAQLTNDATAPSVPLFTQVGLTLTVTLPEPGATLKIYKDQFDVTGQFTLTFNPNGTVTVTPTVAGTFEGVETLTVKALDAIGNPSQASSTFSMDNTATAAPTGTHTVAISNDSGIAGDRVTNDSLVQVTLTLGSALTLATDETLQVSADGGTTWVAATGSGTSWSTADNAVTLVGTGNITARIWDTAGNTRTITLTDGGYTALAPNAPTLVSLIDNHRLYQGTLDPGEETDDNTPTLRYALSGTEVDVGDSIQLYNGSTAVGPAQTITQDDIDKGYVDVTPPPLYAGTYNFNAKLIDAAGNASDASTSQSATIILTPSQRLQGMSGELEDATFLGDPYVIDAQLLALSDGGYVIAWSAPTSDGQDSDVFLQRYTASNVTMGEIQRLQGASGALADARVTLAALSVGQFLVAWESQTADLQGYDIQLQRFDASNSPVGPIQVLSAHSTAADRAPKVTTLANGGYVVAWQANSVDGQGKDVFFQLYDVRGAAAPGGVQRLGAEAGNLDDGMPNVAALSDGGFVIAWSAQTASSGQDVFVQRYDHLAQAIDAPICLEGAPGTSLINADGATMGSSVPSVTALPDGAYVVVWAAATAESPDVFMQRFDADNARAGDAVQLASADYSAVWYPKVIPLANGGFVLGWTGHTNDGEKWDVYLKSFDGQGNSMKTHRLSAAAQAGVLFWDTDVQLTALVDGGYVVSWVGADNIAAIYTQQYAADGSLRGPVQCLSSELSGRFNYNQVVTAMQDGGYVLSWQGWTTDGQDYDLFAQRFDANGKPWVDAIAPTVQALSLSVTGAQNSILNAGDLVSASVSFDEAVYVSGTPQLTLNIGGTLVQANYASGSGTRALVFTHQIAPDQTDTDGISINANSLDLSGGNITDVTGNNASLSHSAWVTITDTPTGSYTLTNSTDTFNFSEGVTGFTADDVNISAGTNGALAGTDGGSYSGTFWSLSTPDWDTDPNSNPSTSGHLVASFQTASAADRFDDLIYAYAVFQVVL